MEPSIGTFKLAEQRGQRGYYAEVSVEATRRPAQLGVSVQFGSNVGQEFRAAALFGLDYAWEHFSRKSREGVEVIVHNIGWAPIDTRGVLVAYAAVQALWNALGFSPEDHVRPDGPQFDDELEGVFFPK